MAYAKEGDTIKVHYIGTVKDGPQFDNSYERQDPLEFTIGSNQLIAGFEKAVIGMEPGGKKTIDIDCDNAYGPYQNELLVTVPVTELPSGMRPKTGQIMKIRQADGQEFAVNVTKVTEQEVTLDANHPLAGKDLTFAIELLEILSPAAGD